MALEVEIYSERYLEIVFEGKTTENHDYYSQVFQKATSTLSGTFNYKIKLSINVCKTHVA